MLDLQNGSTNSVVVSPTPPDLQDLASNARDAAGVPSFAGIPVNELATYANQPVDWLVEWVFSSDQPILFGARSKAGKTTQLTDLSVALATNTKWLGHFVVPKRRRVLFITGESNKRAMARKIHRAIEARNLN